MNIEFTIKVWAYRYYKKHESKLQHNSMFCWKKKHLKSMLYQNKVCDFILQVLRAPPLSPLFSRTLPF
jgi:hypothetical protein